MRTNKTNRLYRHLLQAEPAYDKSLQEYLFYEHQGRLLWRLDEYGDVCGINSGPVRMAGTRLGEPVGHHYGHRRFQQWQKHICALACGPFVPLSWPGGLA